MGDEQMAPATVALIGFGEAAQAFLAGWRTEQPELVVRVFDAKTVDPEMRAEKLAEYDAKNVMGCQTAEEAVEGAAFVFSLVTADQAFAAAQSVGPHLGQGALFFDGNSCAPGTKRKSAKFIHQGQGHYVDAAIMSPVYPKLHQTPILLSGPHSTAANDACQSLNMSARTVDGDVGYASSIKMVRSIMVKGLEALTLECVLAGRKAGVDEQVINSLDASYPGFEFKKRAAYMMERTLTHGPRRAAEMDEVAKTVRDLGFSGGMASATADWQRLAGGLGLKGQFNGDEDYADIADAILSSPSMRD